MEGEDQNRQRADFPQEYQDEEFRQYITDKGIAKPGTMREWKAAYQHYKRSHLGDIATRRGR